MPELFYNLLLDELEFEKSSMLSTFKDRMLFSLCIRGDYGANKIILTVERKSDGQSFIGVLNYKLIGWSPKFRFLPDRWALTLLQSTPLNLVDALNPAHQINLNNSSLFGKSWITRLTFTFQYKTFHIDPSWSFSVLYCLVWIFKMIAIFSQMPRGGCRQFRHSPATKALTFYPWPDTKKKNKEHSFTCEGIFFSLT